MNRYLRVLCLTILFYLSGCGLLSKSRHVNHHGRETNDFDLPVIAYPSTDSTSRKLLLFFSGDGGWLDFEDRLCTSFADQGFETIGFNSRSYFWEGKTPGTTAQDVMLLISKYATLYNINRIYLCGYSFGADVVPFIYNRLVPSLKNKVVAIQLLSPFASSDFMVHTSDLLNIAGDNKPYKVRPEIEQIRIPVLCFYGIDETPRPMEDLKRRNFSLNLIPGGHRYEDTALPEIIASIQGLRRSPLFGPYRVKPK